MNSQTRMHPGDIDTEFLLSKIRQTLKNHGRLGADAGTLPETFDLYEAGLTSHASVNVMLALESEFEIEFPDSMLKRGTFNSILSIRNAVASLLQPS